MIAWLATLGLALAADPGAADILTYPLGPGDEIHLEVVGQPDMSGDLRVAADGTITVPRARSVQVAGLTVDEARAAITSDLGAGYLRSPQVLLDLRTVASRLVEVSGGVQKPDSYALSRGHTSMSRVLLDAGGLLDPSAPEAQIWRDAEGRREVIRVDLERMRRGDPDADPVLQPGDHVYVPQSDQVFVDGQVQKPGAIAYRDGMTVTEAIIQAGSALGTARLRGVYIMRGGERIHVDVKRIQAARAPDFVLQPGDRIYIPESAF